MNQPVVDVRIPRAGAEPLLRPAPMDPYAALTLESVSSTPAPSSSPSLAVRGSAYQSDGGSDLIAAVTATPPPPRRPESATPQPFSVAIPPRTPESAYTPVLVAPPPSRPKSTVTTPLIDRPPTYTRDEPLSRPIISVLILLSCTGCFLFEIQRNGWRFESMSVNPMLGPSVETLVDCGAKITSRILDNHEVGLALAPSRGQSRPQICHSTGTVRTLSCPTFGLLLPMTVAWVCYPLP